MRYRSTSDQGLHLLLCEDRNSLLGHEYARGFATAPRHRQETVHIRTPSRNTLNTNNNLPPSTLPSLIQTHKHFCRHTTKCPTKLQLFPWRSRTPKRRPSPASIILKHHKRLVRESTRVRAPRERRRRLRKRRTCGMRRLWRRSMLSGKGVPEAHVGNLQWTWNWEWKITQLNHLQRLTPFMLPP